MLRLIGRGLSNREIAQKLVVSLDTIRWYNKQIYSKLDVHSRTEAVVRAGELGLLTEGMHAKSGSEVSRPFAAPQRTLPVSLTSLIGRAHDITAVKEMLGESRLVTLTGPAGVGKTRLAVQVTAELLSSYSHGAVFVRLASVSDVAWVASAVATTLGVTDMGGGAPRDLVKTYLRQRQILLILDNFEHLMSVAPLVGEFLEAAPSLSVLVTSREALRLYGEREYSVPPLAVPEARHEQGPDMLARYDAVSLFVERAQAIKARFILTDENANAVAEICQRLDGLPLAIELAAARVKMFSPQALVKRLDDPLTLLSSGARNAPDRQQTLRSAIAWSYDLLTPPEQALFARLGVAPGSLSLEAIEMVCGPIAGLNLLDGLESLLNKSLLRQIEDLRSEPRFTMLETLREYARAQLEEQGGTEMFQQQFAEYFLALAELAGEEFRGPEGYGWIARLETEYENLRSTLAWLFEHNWVESALRMVAALGNFWFYQGHHSEQSIWVGRALAVLDSAPRSLHASVLYTAGRLTNYSGDVAQGKAWCQQALQISRELGNKLDMAWSLIFLAGQSIGRPDDYREAVKMCEESLLLFREVDCKPGTAQALNILGELERLHGDFARAEMHYNACVAVCQITGERLRIAINLLNLSYVAYHMDAPVRSAQYISKSLQLFMEVRGILGASHGLAAVAGPLAALGHAERAARLLGASEALLEALDASQQSGDQPEVDLYVAVVRELLDEDTLQAAWAEGRTLSLEHAIDLALEWLGAPVLPKNLI